MSAGGPGTLPATVVAPAKLTLSLRVTGVRADGYHLIDAEMVELPGGHHLHLDTPDAVAEVLREFFAPLVHAC